MELDEGKVELKTAFDLMFSSKALRKLIHERLRDLGVHPYFVCKELGIPFKAFAEYATVFNTTRIEKPKRRLTQMQLKNFAEAIGIYPSLVVRVKDIDEVDTSKIYPKRKEYIRENYKKLITYYDEYCDNLEETLKED